MSDGRGPVSRDDCRTGLCIWVVCKTGVLAFEETPRGVRVRLDSGTQEHTLV